VGLQVSDAVSQWLLVPFASLLTWHCAWILVADLLVLLDDPFLGESSGFRLVLYDVTPYAEELSTLSWFARPLIMHTMS
jgi:hypothetical protein